MKKQPNIIYKYLNQYISLLTFLGILGIWWAICVLEIVPSFMLPTPMAVATALISDFNLILSHLQITLLEAFLGLSCSIVFGFVCSILMDRYVLLYKAIYPLLVVSQTIPTIAIAPIIILWFGFGIFPKVLLIFMTCFFPITISILSGFQSVEEDMLKLMKSMDSTYWQTLFLVKIPLSLKSFFSGLKIASSYAVVGAVVSEWLGGERGIGVYMTRVKKAYAFDKMFASIIVISLLSVLLVQVVKMIEKKVVYWKE